LKFDTKVVRAGISPDPTTGSILPPIYETATYVLEEVGKDRGFDYTRSSNPTRQVLEANLAAIEGGEYAISFASGMSAVDSVLKLVSAGDHVVAGDDVYGGVTRHFDNILVRYGIDFTYVDSTQPESVRDAITPKTKMLWLETPTNPLLKITDLHADNLWAIGIVGGVNTIITTYDMSNVPGNDPATCWHCGDRGRPEVWFID